jgi:hypothetical protein
MKTGDVSIFNPIFLDDLVNNRKIISEIIYTITGKIRNYKPLQDPRRIGY